MFSLKGQKVFYKGKEVDPFSIMDELCDNERKQLIEILEQIILG